MSDRSTLLSPKLDFWVLGGAYFAALLPAFWLFGTHDGTPAYTRLGLILNYLAYAVNYPHFLVSYLLLYGDHGSKIHKSWRFAWAGIFSPLLILGLLFAAFRAPSAGPMSALLAVMVLFSGWHYIKQIFGSVVIASLHDGSPLGLRQHRALKLNLLSVWVAGVIYVHAYGIETKWFEGVAIASLHPPHWVHFVGLAVVAATTIFLGHSLVAHSRAKLGARSIVSYVGGWAWMLPIWATAVFRAIVPFFHCLQYFAFVIAFRRNKVEARIGHAPTTPRERMRWLLGTAGYVALSIPLGALFFVAVPGWLDVHLHSRFAQLGPVPFAIAFNIFLNLHHFFIDSVIWKGSDPDVRAYLFGPRRATESLQRKAA